jgi:hypothetical protein
MGKQIAGEGKRMTVAGELEKTIANDPLKVLIAKPKHQD